MFSTPAFVPLDHDACVTPVVRGCTPVMERPRPPAPRVRTITVSTRDDDDDDDDVRARRVAHPAPAQKTVAETTPGYVVYRAIPLHDGRAPKPKPAARRRQQLDELGDGSAMAREASFTFDTAAADERAPPASTSDGRRRRSRGAATRVSLPRGRRAGTRAEAALRGTRPLPLLQRAPPRMTTQTTLATAVTETEEEEGEASRRSAGSRRRRPRCPGRRPPNEKGSERAMPSDGVPRARLVLRHG